MPLHFWQVAYLRLILRLFLTQKRLFKTHMAQNYYRPSLDGTDTFAKKN